MCQRTDVRTNNTTPTCRPPYPKVYHEKSLEVWLTLNPVTTEKCGKCRGRIFIFLFQNGCHEAQKLQIAITSKTYYFSLHLNIKMISRDCSFDNYTHLRMPKLRLTTDFVGEGHICHPVCHPLPSPSQAAANATNRMPCKTTHGSQNTPTSNRNKQDWQTLTVRESDHDV